jgi:hypothetical protein
MMVDLGRSRAAAVRQLRHHHAAVSIAAHQAARLGPLFAMSVLSLLPVLTQGIVSTGFR